MNNHQYKSQVALLIRIIPLIHRIKDFVVHGGAAINLFHQNMPRYSVGINLTYIPLEARSTSLEHISLNLQDLKTSIEQAVSGIHVVHKIDVWKLQCTYNGTAVRIEVDGTKRGVLGEVGVMNLCPKAKDELQANCKARIVPYPQLYGGKIAAAFGRQHPRDLFDRRYMKDETLDEVKNDLFLYLLGSDKSIIESLCPDDINQKEALEHQFKGMTDIPFTYEDYESSRNDIVRRVNACLTDEDKDFIISFEEGPPQWELCCAGDLSRYLSVQWKLLNIEKPKKQSQKKFQEGIDKLKTFFEKMM